MRQRAQRLFAEYGVTALVLHYVIFGVVFAGAWLALRAGWRPSTTIAKAGLVTMAYAVVKVTMPVRLVVTAALVPFVARGWERLTGRPVHRPVQRPVQRPATESVPAAGEPAPGPTVDPA